MSCALLPISQINDVEKLEGLLKDFVADQQEIVDKGFSDGFGLDENTNNWDDGWEDADEWPAESVAVESKPVSSGKVWLQSCKLSLSPTEDLIAIAKEDKGIYLTKKWPKGTTTDEKPFYEITWSGELTTEENEQVTCIFAVPLASQQRSSQGSPDWTCIITGYSTGYIRIYTSNGTLLLSQFLHDGPVLNINIKTKSLLMNFGEQVDELIILYQNAIVTIDGFSLYQSLRACRNQLAKAQASLSGDSVEPPPLAYRKWRSGNQKRVTDCIGCGVSSPSFFDRLQAASVIDGQQAKVKGSTPAFNRFLTTGSEPFLCYYQALEGSNQPILSDVALAYASKLTSAVFSSVKQLTMASSWFGGGGQSKTPEKDVKPKVERGTALPARFGLFDQHRLTDTIKISPIGNLAVITDTLSRVLLMNSSTGVIMRIWKGYRDAECGWIVVEEEEDEGENGAKDRRLRRRALFMVIYAPKRGILEIYLTEHGTRVGAFNVGKNCRLICPTYQCLGQTRVPMGFNCNTSNQCFLLQEDGTIKTIQVPFHCSLSNVHSIRAKDAHQLKRVSAWIEKGKEKPNNDEIIKSLVSIVLDIQAPSMQKKAVEVLLNTTGVASEFLESSLSKICSGIQKGFQSEDAEQEDLEYHSEKQELLIYCNAQKHLINLYLAVCNLRQKKQGPDSDIDFTTDRDQCIAELLHITLSEATEFLSVLGRYQNTCLDSPYKHTTGGGCVLPVDINVNTFLSSFQIISGNNNKRDSRDAAAVGSSSSHFRIEFNQNISKEVSLGIGSLFFESVMKGEASISRLAFILESSRIHPNQIMMLLTTYSQSEINSEVLFKDNAMALLYSLVASICALKDGAEKQSVDLPVGKVSLWWQSVRDVLSQSVLIGQSLVMAIVCRSVAMEVQSAVQKVQTQDESDIVSGGWEAVTVDMEKWNLLVCQLENLIDVDCFIHSNHARASLSGVESPTFKRHMHAVEAAKEKTRKGSKTRKERDGDDEGVKTSNRMAALSVRAIIENSHDAIPQIVADCLVRQGVPGPCLGTRKSKKHVPFRGRLATVNQGDEMDVDVTDDDVPEQDESTDNYDTLTALVELRDKFPYSLEQDRLWAHCVWESIMVWNEDTEDVSMLRSALIYLSCIHNTCTQQGLGAMMWKAVFNESIKSTLSLIEKVGKAPKDRLCRKTVSLSSKALEEFLDVAKKLLEILMDLSFVDDESVLEIRTEDIWKDENTRQQQSIMKQANDETQCNGNLLNHYWCLVTSLHLIMLGTVRSIKPLSMFDTKGKHAFTFALHSSPVLSSELDDKIIKARREFCFNTTQSIVKQHFDLTFQDEMARNNTSDLLHTMATIFNLATSFKVSQEEVRQFAACELYRVGLDLAAQEVSMVIEDKESFSSRMIEIVGGRIAKSLLAGETDKCSDALSKLPTNVSSWLAKLERSKASTVDLPIAKTYLLLQYLSSNLTSHSREAKFINELIECLKVFL